MKFHTEVNMKFDQECVDLLGNEQVLRGEEEYCLRVVKNLTEKINNENGGMLSKPEAQELFSAYGALLHSTTVHQEYVF